MASSLGPAWPVLVKVNNRSIIGGFFPLRVFHVILVLLLYDLIACIFILFLSKLHVIFLIWYQSGLTWTLQ